MPGNIVICYCAVMSDQNDCKTRDLDGRSYWTYANRIMIYGPRTVKMKFPTNMVFGMQLEGFGFSPTDTFRELTTFLISLCLHLGYHLL